MVSDNTVTLLYSNAALVLGLIVGIVLGIALTEKKSVERVYSKQSSPEAGGLLRKADDDYADWGRLIRWSDKEMWY